MSMRADFHMHTTFCDGKNTPEEMVQRGIEIGLSVMGFSVHSPLTRECTWAIRPDKTAEYRAEINRLREKYADQIRIYCGIEQDCYTNISPSGYDYIIGSAHAVFREGVYTDVDFSADASWDAINRFYDGDQYAFAEDYFTLVGGIVEKTGADIIGHFDLLSKFQDCGLSFDVNHPRYAAAWKAAADKLLKTGVPFEINTGAISRGYRKTPYPAPEILRYIADHGGRAIINSDSHMTDALGCSYDAAYKLAKEIGIPLVKQIKNIHF